MRTRECIVIFILVLFTFCSRPDTRLILVNNETETVFYIISNEPKFSFLEKPINYDKANNIIYSESDCLQPSDSCNPLMRMTPTGWEQFIKESNDDKLYIFVFKKSLIERTKWDSLVVNQISSSMKVFSLKEIEENSWRIAL